MPQVLSTAQRQALKARAHPLEAVVAIGNAGLTPQVLKEIDVSLSAHELIKIRAGGDREERESLLQRICDELDAGAVQHIGKLLVVYRPAPEGKAPAPSTKRRKPKRLLKRNFQNRP
ncbi:MAG: YhbY family RNA-binding protein [Burkholderiales bacterium]